MYKLKRLAAALLLTLPVSLVYAADVSYHYGDQDYSGKTLPAAVRIQLNELETKVNQQRKDIIDQYILDAWLRDKAKEAGKTPEEYAAKALEVKEPDEKALRKYYDANWERIQRPYKEVKDELIAAVWAEQQQEKIKEVLQQIATEKNYEVNLPEPEPLVFDIKTEGYPSKGSTNATVTLVEFADFQCPHCKEGSEIADKVMKKYSDKMRIVYRHMPINPSGISRKVAAASICADQQGKFWEYHDLAFKNQEKLDDKSPMKLATELKLDEAKMKTCLEDPKTDEALTASETEGRNLGVNGTPAFFVNGQPFRPQLDMEKELTAAVESALGKTADTTPAPASTESASTTTTSATSTSTSTTSTTTTAPASTAPPSTEAAAPATGSGVGTCTSGAGTAATGTDSANCKPE
ncbi:MAG: DsbA family protein [Thiolinea sp.]